MEPSSRTEDEAETFSLPTVAKYKPSSTIAAVVSPTAAGEEIKLSLEAAEEPSPAASEEA